MVKKNNREHLDSKICFPKEQVNTLGIHQKKGVRLSLRLFLIAEIKSIQKSDTQQYTHTRGK